MIYKLQNAGSLPKWMQKLNSWSIPDSDESAGEHILNSTIKQANNASTQEERDQIYKDSAKKNLAVTGKSLMMIPMLNEFATYGLLGGGLRLGAGIAGSKAGEYVLGKGGDWADKKLNTKFLGTTGRILGGLGGWWGGSSATTPLFRNLAGKGITLHMPQETFMNLRGQYFDRAAKNIKLDTSTLPKLQYRDRLTKDYLEFGPDSNISGDNVSKLVHWDPMTTGTRSALPINGGFNRDPVYFPHFENGKLVPAIGQIRSKLGNGQMYEHPYHPIFFGGNKPWWETPGSNFSDQYLKQTTFNKSKFTGPKQYYDRWAKTERRNLRNLRNWYTKYGPQNKSDRYLITDPENLVDYEFSHKLGIMGSEVPMSKLEGFEYDPLLGTFKRARYTDPSKQTRVIPEGTYPLYTGPKHSIIEVVNPDGTVNPRAALRIEREVADNIPGAYRMEARLENPEWHKSDPTTWAHTKNVAQSAWTIPTPKGLTKQDQMVAALGHDLGKIVSGDGHAKSSAALIEQIFPDITAQQLEAISEHMGTPKSILGKVTKQADILNGKPAITRFVGDNDKIRLRLPSHTVEKPRELVLDPQGNNKFRVHTRTWDGDHIPAEMSVEDKNTLFNALYEELPEGAEILFPESGPGNYATRGTVAGLQRLARDSRFKPTDNGMLQYIDKDGSIKTFEGTGFRKPKSIKPVSRPITEAERLGIPKGERSNPKVLEDPYYWGYQQWNSRYNAAVNSGNLQEAQRLRDLHFKIKAPDTKVVDASGNPLHTYHGFLPSRRGVFTKFKGVNFDVEHAVKEGSKTNHWKLSIPNEHRMTSYHTPNYNHALTPYASGNPDNVYDDYLYIKNPFTWNEENLHNILLNSGHTSEKIPFREPGRFRKIAVRDSNGNLLTDENGSIIFKDSDIWIPEKSGFRYPQISDWADFRGNSKTELMKLGYDGLYIPQYYDSYGAFVSPSQFKSAEPITRTDSGEIIPIVKRDNFHNLDRRYKQGGKIK